MTDDEEKIEYLFYKGYTYEEIVGLLSVHFGIQVSLSTLKRACMCTKEPTFYDTNSLSMFWVLAKPDCCFLIIYYTLEA